MCSDPSDTNLRKVLIGFEKRFLSKRGNKGDYQNVIKVKDRGRVKNIRLSVERVLNDLKALCGVTKIEDFRLVCIEVVILKKVVLTWEDSFLKVTDSLLS